jgi:hypothetical protein
MEGFMDIKVSWLIDSLKKFHPDSTIDSSDPIGSFTIIEPPPESHVELCCMMHRKSDGSPDCWCGCE